MNVFHPLYRTFKNNGYILCTASWINKVMYKEIIMLSNYMFYDWIFSYLNICNKWIILNYKNNMIYIIGFPLLHKYELGDNMIRGSPYVWKLYAIILSNELQPVCSRTYTNHDLAFKAWQRFLRLVKKLIVNV